MKKVVVISVFILFLLLDFWVNVFSVTSDAKAYKVELEEAIPVRSTQTAKHEFSDAIFGDPVDDAKAVVEIASGPSEALLGKYKVELKAILIEHNLPIALISIKNIEQPLEMVGNLSKITQGQELVGFTVSEVTLNQVTFTSGEQKAVIKIFDGKNDV